MKKLKNTLILTTLLITVCSQNTTSDDYIYYAINDSIYKVNTNTKKSSIFYKQKGTVIDDDFIIQDDWIYGVIDTERGLCDLISPYIFKIRTNGEDFQMLVDGMDFTIYDGNIYYMKQEFSEDQGYFKSGIYKMSLDKWFAGVF